MKQWLTRFWSEHGDRLVFLMIALIMATALWVFVESLRGQAEAVIVGSMMLFFNKARGTNGNGMHNNEETPSK